MTPEQEKQASANTPKQEPAAPSLNTSIVPDGQPEPGSVASWQEAARFDRLMGRNESMSMDEYYENEARAAARAEQQRDNSK